MYFLFFSFFFLVFFVSFFLGVYFVSGFSLYLDFFFSYSDFTDFSFIFLFDHISLFFFSCVSLISSIVFLYSKFYMDYKFLDLDLNISRFFYLLMLFVVSMMLLVFSGSWVVTLLGWDGLGLVSFLLVIYYNNSSSLDSGLLTVFVNRLGDCFFIISFMFFFYSGWFSFDFLTFYCSFFFCFFLLLGCLTKSAQLPFSSWLPAAMAAPTPVSSLVHSSTLVTAGVYLLIRFNVLFFPIMYFLSVISLLTMFVAGLSSLFEKDFKKIVAMSTLSQLGFMIFSLSLGLFTMSFLHMLFHAFFKSLLFLSTGSLMHFVLGDQDSRNFGSFGFSFFSKLMFSVSCLSLMGFPFTIGFYSKDLILGLSSFNFSGALFLLFFSCCIFTVSYSMRLLNIGFLSYPSFTSSFSFVDSFFFYFPVFLLYLFCVFFGNFFFFFFTSPLIFSFFECFIGILAVFLGFFLFKHTPHTYFIDYFFMHIGFLAVFFSPYFSFLYSFSGYSSEYTWGETLGAGGLSFFLKFLSFFFNYIFVLSISFVLMFFVVFFFLLF